MALTNTQYNEIMREYDKRQLHNQRIHSEHMQEAYKRYPKLKELDDATASCYVQKAISKMNGNEEAVRSCEILLADYSKEKQDILDQADFPAGYFEPVYTCPDCKDTGYIDGQKCHCFKQAIINTVYSQSNIREILNRENFSSFSFDYFSDQDISSATGLSSLQTMHNAVATCKDFINDFDNKPKNLLLLGDTGVGKTFLSNCVAKELLDQGRSVIYFTAFQLFDILSKGIFERDSDAIAANQNIFDCDLLIIDDLGTELSNSFTTSQLFLCVNERILRRKSTIISTNLGLNQVAEVYSERTLSRISSNYSIVKLFGEDIRIKKRKMR